MPDALATSGQVKRLQVLWQQSAKRELGLSDREARMVWATQFCGRPINSFNELTAKEASAMIDVLQTSLGLPVTPPRRMSRARAAAAGKAGRRGDDGRVEQIATKKDLDMVARALNRLGWSLQRFEAFMRSPSAPLRGRTTMRTVADVNRVWSALKAILKREGKWEERAG